LPKIGLVLAGFVVAFLLLEAIARITHLGTGGFWEPYPLYGWRNIPNSTGWESCFGECSVFVRINSKGLRNRETSYNKTPGQKRILFLGDSLTAAMQVPLEETFAQVLEQHLNSASSAGDWEVINAGVNAFGTDNELLFYRLEASKYQPDIVILGIYLANDIYNNSYELEKQISGQGHKPYFEINGSGELILKNFPVQQTDSIYIRMGSFLKKNFQFPRFIAQVMDLRKRVPAALRPLIELAGGQRGASATNGKVEPSGQKVDICAGYNAPEIEEAWAITKALIKELRNEVNRQGAKFYVLAIPASPQLVPPAQGKDWYCDRPNRELDQFLEAERIPYLDLLEPFRQHIMAEGTPLYFSRDFHMNLDGNRLAGDLLYGFIKVRLANNLLMNP
jgi:lysophospholipase L1-like esterase